MQRCGDCLKTLHRNKQTFYYSNYLDKLPLKDENGDLTGEYTNYYSVPASALGYITAARGQAELDMFGVNTNYTKTIITDYDLGLTEDSILWIENDTAHSYDYIVVAVAKSLNHFTYAIRAVNVDYTVPFAVDLGTLDWTASTGIFLATVPNANVSSVGWCDSTTRRIDLNAESMPRSWSHTTSTGSTYTLRPDSAEIPDQSAESSEVR